MARVLEAVVDVDFAEVSVSARGARALVAVVQVGAGPAVLARIRITVVDVGLTVFSLVAFGAGAEVRVDEVLTRAAMLTGIGAALVHLVLAVATLEPRLADALVGVALVDAVAVVQTEPVHRDML